jgi:hypothetical protein
VHGEKGARLAAQSHTAAIDRTEAIVAAEAIDCDFERVDGYLFVPPGESTDVLSRELEAAHRAGLTGVKLIARAPRAVRDGPLAALSPSGAISSAEILGRPVPSDRKGGRQYL